MRYRNINDAGREAWLKSALSQIPSGGRILDAGAGERRYRTACAHLKYVSHDFCQYEGVGDGSGLQTGTWNTEGIDIVSDITAIPQPDDSFDAILCSEVLEHVPEPIRVLQEFRRLLRVGGTLILTAPFASIVHFAPYHYYSGFSRYWYEYHLPMWGFRINQLTSNGDWFCLCEQELRRLGSVARNRGDRAWPLAYGLGLLGSLYFMIRGGGGTSDLGCFGWHCIATRV